MNNDARYTSYQNMVTQVNTGLVQMQKAAGGQPGKAGAAQVRGGHTRRIQTGKKYSNQFPSGEGNYAVGYPSDFGYDESGNL